MTYEYNSIILWKQLLFSETHTHNCTQAIQNLQRTLDSAAMKYGHEKGWK